MVGARACLVTIALAAACAKTLPVRGQLMVVVETNLTTPRDFDVLRVEVKLYGEVLHAVDYAVGTGSKWPASLGIVAGSAPSSPVLVRVMAKQGGAVSVLREARTTIPTDRIAALPMALEQSCVDRVATTSDGDVTTT